MSNPKLNGSDRRQTTLGQARIGRLLRRHCRTVLLMVWIMRLQGHFIVLIKPEQKEGKFMYICWIVAGCVCVLPFKTPSSAPQNLYTHIHTSTICSDVR